MALRSKPEVKAKAGLFDPPPPPPNLFGPSSLKITRTDIGWHYSVNLWVGGTGLADGGEWGRTINYACIVPFNDPVDVKSLVWSLALGKSADLMHLFSEEDTVTITYLLGHIAGGGVLSKTESREVLLERLTCNP